MNAFGKSMPSHHRLEVVLPGPVVAQRCFEMIEKQATEFKNMSMQC